MHFHGFMRDECARVEIWLICRQYIALEYFFFENVTIYIYIYCKSFSHQQATTNLRAFATPSRYIVEVGKGMQRILDEHGGGLDGRIGWTLTRTG